MSSLRILAEFLITDLFFSASFWIIALSSGTRGPMADDDLKLGFGTQSLLLRAKVAKVGLESLMLLANGVLI
jgi:hypothetical protein